MSQRFRDYDQKEEKEESAGSGGLDFELPKTSNILDRLDAQIQSREEIAREHQAQEEKEEEEVKKGKRKPRQKPKGGTICFCGNPFCRIGEFVQTQGE